MDLLSWFCVFMFFHFWCFDSSQGQNTSYSNCTNEFQCGNLTNLSFPFYKSTEHDCGLCKVDCDVDPNPIIELDGVKYQALQKNDVFITLKDSSLEELLKKNNCKIFEKNVSLPISPSITYRLDRLLTLFRCNRSHNSTYEGVFNSKSFQSYNVCDSFMLYYNISASYYYDPVFPLPIGCSFIRLPRNLEAKSNSSGLFHLLTDEVILGWTVSDQCNQCYYTGGRCLTNNTTNQFHCSNTNTNKGHKTGKVIVAASALIGSLVGLCAIACVLWFYIRKKNDFSSVISRNTSGISMIHHELEERCEYLGIPVFSYAELEEATNKFNSSRKLGDGGYGTVYYGKLRDGKEIAVKSLYENNNRQMQQFINEIEILTRLRHPNLVTLYGCTSRRIRELFLVYEYIPNGTISDHLHASDIIHRDVKTNNILLKGLQDMLILSITNVTSLLIRVMFIALGILKCAFDEVIDPSLGFETDAEVRRMTISVAELAFQCLQVVKDMRPTMEEVHETLKTIKYGEWKNYHKKDSNSCNTKPSTVKVRRYPSETDDAVLLKKNIPASPDTVIDTWASSSTATSTGG